MLDRILLTWQVELLTLENEELTWLCILKSENAGGHHIQQIDFGVQTNAWLTLKLRISMYRIVLLLARDSTDIVDGFLDISFGFHHYLL